MQSLQRVHASKNSSSLIANGGRIQCDACLLTLASTLLTTALPTASPPLFTADLKKFLRSMGFKL